MMFHNAVFDVTRGEPICSALDVMPITVWQSILITADFIIIQGVELKPNPLFVNYTR